MRGNKTKNIQNYNDMFKGNDLTSLDGLETWDTSGAATMRYMFSDSDPNSTANYAHGSYITNIDSVSGWNVSNVTDLMGTFAGIIPDDLTALANWDVCRYIFTPLSGVRAHKVTLMSRIFEGDRSITTLSALEYWYDDLGTPENITRVTIDYAFAYMYGLTDISALNTWTGGNNKVQTYSMRGLMRGDYNIASGSAKTYLENACFKML